MVSHQQAQLTEQSSTIIHHLLFSATATMAKFFTTCTYPNVLGLFSLTVCVMLATSAPARHVRQVSDCDRREDIHNETITLVSFNMLCHW